MNCVVTLIYSLSEVVCLQVHDLIPLVLQVLVHEEVLDEGLGHLTQITFLLQDMMTCSCKLIQM